MEAIPVVDLRLLSQAEIHALSRASSSAAGDPCRSDDLVVPKIDRSVFNESAGSRKQTYSRLRLAPRKPPLDLSSSSSSSGPARARGRPPSSALPLPPPPPPPSDDPGRQENRQIVLFLRQLFAKNGIEIPTAPPPAVNEEPAAVPTPGADANLSAVGSALGTPWREQGAPEVPSKDREVLNPNGGAVDVVGLGEKEDPFGPELKRRTQGLVKEEEFLRFLSGLEGHWGSPRRRRRIVDASIFGDVLPKGWKLLLGLKRKDGNIWLHCRRYISPSGKQFISCKEVSLYLLSFIGSQEARQEAAAQSSTDKLGNELAVGHSHQVNITSRSPSFSTATPISTIPTDSGKQVILYSIHNPAKDQLQDVLKCQECNLTFADKGTHVQHLLTFHRSSGKRRKLGQSLVDGVIMRDGKYECQFCHKTFTERRRYNGHVGIHVKYHNWNLKPATDEITIGKNITSSSHEATSAFGKLGNSVDSGKQTKLIEENMSTKSIHIINDGHPQGNQHLADSVSDHTLECYDNNTEKIMVRGICTTGAIDEIKNSFPLGSGYDNDKEGNVMKEMQPLLNDEMNEVSPLKNMLVESRKTEHNMNCSDDERSLVQDVCNVQCIGEINDNSPPSNKQNNVDKIDCFLESNNETSESRFVGSTANDCSMTDQKPRGADESGTVMNGDMHTLFDYTCSSFSDVGKFPSEGSPKNDFSNIAIDEIERSNKLKMTSERHSIGLLGLQTSTEIAMSPESVDGTENSENEIHFDNNKNVLTGVEQCHTRNAVAICTTGELAEVVKSGNELENNLECIYTSSDGALTMKNIVHGDIQLSGTTEKGFIENSMLVSSGKKYCDMDNAIGDMLPDSEEEIMLNIMDHSGNEMNDDLMSDDTILNADALRNDTGLADEQNMQSLPLNMKAFWEQTSGQHPILDIISEQGNGQDSRQQSEEQLVYTAALENGPGPCIQLEWVLAPQNFGPRRRMSTVCVWCSAEFEQDDVDFELHPDSVGFMCPTCKLKTSRQFNGE